MRAKAIHSDKLARGPESGAHCRFNAREIRVRGHSCTHRRVRNQELCRAGLVSGSSLSTLRPIRDGATRLRTPTAAMPRCPSGAFDAISAAADSTAPHPLQTTKPDRGRDAGGRRGVQGLPRRNGTGPCYRPRSGGSAAVDNSAPGNCFLKISARSKPEYGAAPEQVRSSTHADALTAARPTPRLSSLFWKLCGDYYAMPPLTSNMPNRGSRPVRKGGPTPSSARQVVCGGRREKKN